MYFTSLREAWTLWNTMILSISIFGITYDRSLQETGILWNTMILLSSQFCNHMPQKRLGSWNIVKYNDFAHLRTLASHTANALRSQNLVKYKAFPLFVILASHTSQAFAQRNDCVSQWFLLCWLGVHVVSEHQIIVFYSICAHPWQCGFHPFSTNACKSQSFLLICSLDVNLVRSLFVFQKDVFYNT